MKIHANCLGRAGWIACVFVLTQCVPYGFTGQGQLAAAAKANPVAVKKAINDIKTASANPTPQQKTTAINQVRTSVVGGGTSIDFLSKGATISKPVASVAAPQGSAKKAGAVIAALESKAASQTKVSQADTAKIVGDAKTLLAQATPQGKAEVVNQIKADAKIIRRFNSLAQNPQAVHYGQGPWAEGDLLIPQGHSPNSAPAPVVILIHGGGFYTGDRSDVKGQANYLTNQGYAVLNIDYKLNNIDIALKDTLDAIQWVNNNAATLNLDVNNISVIGFSAGATLATMVATQYPERINCAVAFSPAVNREPATSGFNPNYTRLAPTYSGSEPLSSVSPRTAPTLVFTGGQFDQPGFGDPAVEFAERLRTNNVGGGTVVVQAPPSNYRGYGLHGSALMTPKAAPQTEAPMLEFLRVNQRN